MSSDDGQRHALGVDFGTSNTVAVARRPDGRARTLLIDGSPLLPSAVYAEPSGALSVGRDAVHSARLDPARFEPNPKRRIDDGEVLLGDREFPVSELITAVLARVMEEWERNFGQVKPDVTLTCPATWGATRRTLLAEAAAAAGLEGARLVAEPVAAATYFAEVLGRDVPIGSVVVVHDFGAGTFDVSVVARTGEGFEVLAVDGRDDIGGLDVDAAIVEHLRTDDWGRLMEPTTLEERRAQRQLWDDVRIAKERLSRAQSADFVIPLLDTEAHLTRDELEKAARPVIEETVRITEGLLKWANLPEGRLAGVFLVGGASRIPLVATLLHRALGEAPVVIEQPELAVAEGSILAGAALLATDAAAPGPTAELRLVSNGLAEIETVRVEPPAPAQPQPVQTPHIPGTTGLQPPVDPWPDAVPDSWTPDPDATIATPPPSAYEPAATVPLKARSAPVSPARTAPPRQIRREPAAVPTRPSPPRPQAQPQPQTRPMVHQPQVHQPQVHQPQVRQPQRKPAKRRRGRFVRFLQILLSMLVMIVVPIAALVVAYGYGDGETWRENVTDLLHDLADLAGVQY